MKRFLLLVVLVCGASTVHAESPVASYIFPAGGQRGTAVKLRVGGLFLHKSCSFEMLGPGLDFSKKLTRMPTVWFEGPLLHLPDSQRQEDYPKDMAGEVKIAGDTPLGTRYWRLATSQGCTPHMKFVVGDLPEIVEEEIDGDPIAVDVTLPVTINGRIFPRADVDLWRFQAKKGQSVTCEVVAARLGSPLDAHLEIVDANGKRLEEARPLPGGDVRLRFIAPSDGPFQARIHDAAFQGSQAHVYRLTITADAYVDRVFPLGGKRGARVDFELDGQNVPARTTWSLPVHGAFTWHQMAASGKRSNPILLDLDDVQEFLEIADKPMQVPMHVPLPAMCNGRIEKPGATGVWQVPLKKGETLEAELRAARLGSPLDGILTIRDAAGKELARTDQPVPEWNDPLLRFTAPVDGTYAVGVQDRFKSRGGRDYAYRLRLNTTPAAEFLLRIPTTSLNVPRGGKAELLIALERVGAFKEPVALTVDGLPRGVTVKLPDLAKGGPGKIVFEADKEAAIQAGRVVIRGTAKIGEQSIAHTAATASPFGQPPVETILVSVALPTPFKIKGVYDMRWAARGSLHERLYQIERNGFDGPLAISLTDRQARHLQGVHAAPIIVPAGATEFRYAIQLPPWMETGRTSRTCVMAVGVIKDKDGSEHEVSFSSVNQNEQMVAVVEPGKLDLSVERTSLGLCPGKKAEVRFQVSRAKGLEGPVTVELIVPAHIKGLNGQPVTLKGDETGGRFVVEFSDLSSGPINMPLVLRATLLDNGRPVTAETRIEAVPLN
ncbi:MAG: PPC domain-containing protein [Planctomycetes bacterium]|nr:PPC domain-containing protein [Planctomycetota bacterium]